MYYNRISIVFILISWLKGFTFFYRIPQKDGMRISLEISENYKSKNVNDACNKTS